LNVSIYGLGQCHLVAIEQSSRRRFILDQCFGVGCSGSNYMTFGDGKILLVGDDRAVASGAERVRDEEREISLL
jgi:hypothetical protein